MHDAPSTSSSSSSTTDEPATPELKTATWRVLRRDPDTVAHVTRWNELKPITGSGEYGFHPTAKDLGEAYGVGDYLLVSCDTEARWYKSARSIIVAAQAYFYEPEPEPTPDRRAELEAELEQLAGVHPAGDDVAAARRRRVEAELAALDDEPAS